MGATIAILRRELVATFTTPLAYVFIVVFLALAGALTFFLGAFFERGEADLGSFFTFHPWLYLFLVPAVAMRLWAEERRGGTLELLMTLPVTSFQAVLGKWLAAWIFCGVALALTFPVWIAVNWLGEPDNGVILTGYLGSWVMAGAFLAIGSCMSALATNQVVAFVLGAAACFLLICSGMTLVLSAFQGWAPAFVVDLVSSFSMLTHFNALAKGLVTLPTVVFLASLIGTALLVNTLLLDLRRAG